MKSRFTAEQIVGILNEAMSGTPVREVCRKHGVTENTFYVWRRKYGRMQASEAKRLKALEDENRRLKKLVADLSLDNAMLKDIVGRKW
jgi:putative transposase